MKLDRSSTFKLNKRFFLFIQVDFPLRILVSSEMVGAIIGRGGSTIRAITQQSRARVDVHRKVDHMGSVEKAITVYGQPENCTTACQRILEVDTLHTVTVPCSVLLPSA